MRPPQRTVATGAASLHASSSAEAAAAAAADEPEKPRAQMMARRESRAVKVAAASAEVSNFTSTDTPIIVCKRINKSWNDKATVPFKPECVAVLEMSCI